jgi:hypothetical protein
MDSYNKEITKSLKKYTKGKHLSNTDKEKSFEYFKECINLLYNIKQQKHLYSEEYSNIIDETETECKKYIVNNIYNNLSSKLVINNKYNADLIFNYIYEGNLNEIKKLRYIDFDIFNNEGQSLLHAAISNGDTNIITQLLKLGGEIDQTNSNGNSLLEYASLQQDPNMQQYLIDHGADMDKHLFFRDIKKYNSKGKSIDIVILQKMIMEYNNKNTNNKYYLDFLSKHINLEDSIDLLYINNKKSEITYKQFFIKLNDIILCLDENTRNTYIEIIKEELSYKLEYNLGCPSNYIDIILYTLIPFVNEYINSVYKKEYNLRLKWLYLLEIKYNILKILKNNNISNIETFKDDIISDVYNNYIQKNLVPFGFMEIIILQWFNKIKV